MSGVTFRRSGEQIDLVDRTYRAMARGRVEMPPKIGVHSREDAFAHAMPAYLRDEDIVALKWVSGFPANPRARSWTPRRSQQHVRPR